MDISDNGLVASLSERDQSLLRRRCESVELQPGAVLGSPGAQSDHIYFLAAGATVALFVDAGSGAGLAVGLAGHEGAVGLPLALGMGAGNLTLMVQTAGTAWRIDGNAMQRMAERSAPLLLVLSRYLWGVAGEVAAVAARSQVQDIKTRLAQWVLLSGRRAGRDALLLTHQQLASMLGVRRSSVTLAAVELKEQGLLDYQRGRLLILDWPRLESAANSGAAPALARPQRATA